MAIKLEVPIFSPASANAAVRADAARLELNAAGSYPAGGLTPTIEDLTQVQSLKVPIRVMIRPRGPPTSGARDFVYSDAELEAMEQSIYEFKSSGLLSEERGDGFVFGVLCEIGNDEATNFKSASAVLALDSCTRLANAAKPYKTVLHRAFDELVRSGTWREALGQLVGCGFDGVLTSGGPGNAVDNMENLDRILEEAGDRIEIILGGGVRSTNAGRLVRSLRADTRARLPWAHSSCLTRKGTEMVDTGEVASVVAEI
ncbi:CutC family protein [Seiridium cupressi]